MIAQAYSAIIAVSVAVGFWFGKALSANGPQKPKESYELEIHAAKDALKNMSLTQGPSENERAAKTGRRRCCQF